MPETNKLTHMHGATGTDAAAALIFILLFQSAPKKE